jgi:hypothetical protein
MALRTLPLPAMDTLGLWFGPALAVVLAAVGNKWLGWFQPRSRRRVALRRIAERLASEDSAGYDYKHERYLEHYLGGRDWQEEWDKSDTKDGDGRFYDSRGPAPKWWKRPNR